MCALKGIPILASNAKCTYLRRSVGTLLYLSIRGVQCVIMINVMLMIVMQIRDKCCSCTKQHCCSRRDTATPEADSTNAKAKHHSMHECHTLA